MAKHITKWDMLKLSSAFEGSFNPADFSEEELYEMLGLLGVPPQNLTVAGDNLNDLEMIREFSSFAVSSGRAELKAEANFVAPDIAAIVSHLL